MAIQVGVFLFGHQANKGQLGAYGQILHAVHQSHGAYTVFLTGITSDAIHREHPLIKAKSPVIDSSKI